MSDLIVKKAVKDYVKKEGYAISLSAFETLNDRVEDLLGELPPYK